MNRTEYLLICLMEECAEVQKIAAKSLRFGLANHHPDGIETNREALERELKDVDATRYMLAGLGIVPFPIVIDQDALLRKIEKVTRFMEVSKMCGTLELHP